MHVLSLKETETISGGMGGYLFFAGVGAGILGTLSYSALTSTPQSYKTYYEPKVTYYDVTTPVYDGNGLYQGDIVNTYADTSYVPVTLYV